MLLIETITWKPHIETAMEIALRHSDGGGNVIYCNLRKGLPVCEDSSSAHVLLDLPSIRIARARNLLESAGITVNLCSYSPEERAEAIRWGESKISECSNADDVTRIAHESFFDLGWGVMSSAISMSMDSNVSPGSHKKLLVRLAASARMVYEKSVALIRQHDPDEVMLFNGRFATTRAVMRAAESEGKPWRIHERGCDMDHFFVADCPIHDPACFQSLIKTHCTDQPLDAGHDFFLDKRAGCEKGWHSFAAGQKTGQLPKEMLSTGEWVTFFTSSEDELAAWGDVLLDPAFPNQIEAIRSVAQAVNAVGNLGLCIRIHPFIAQKSAADRAKWERLEIPGTLVVGPSERVDSYALIDRSKVVATFGSTVGVEATYWGRPSLLLGPSFFDRLNVCYRAESIQDIEKYLAEPVAYPREGALRFGVFSYSFGERYRYYRPDNLHRGSILGTYLDDAPQIVLAKRLAAIPRTLRERMFCVT